MSLRVFVFVLNIILLILLCFVCLFVLGVFWCPTRDFFSFIWIRDYYRWRTANSDHARHSWPLSSEGSSHLYCDTGHPFIMVISEDPWHSHLLPGVKYWSCRYLFLWQRLKSVATGIQTHNLIPHARRTLDRSITDCVLILKTEVHI